MCTMEIRKGIRVNRIIEMASMLSIPFLLELTVSNPSLPHLLHAPCNNGKVD